MRLSCVTEIISVPETEVCHFAVQNLFAAIHRGEIRLLSVYLCFSARLNPRHSTPLCA
jgi:hypothetical protein